MDSVKAVEDVLQAVLVASAVWLALETRGQRRAASRQLGLLRRQVANATAPYLHVTISKIDNSDAVKAGNRIFPATEISDLHLNVRNIGDALATDLNAWIYDGVNKHYRSSRLYSTGLQRRKDWDIPIASEAHNKREVEAAVLRWLPNADPKVVSRILEPTERSFAVLFCNDVEQRAYAMFRPFFEDPDDKKRISNGPLTRYRLWGRNDTDDH